MRALRTIPVMDSFAKELKEIFAKHDAKIEHGKKLVAEGKLGKRKQ